MQAANTPCSLEHTIDATAIEAPEALPPGEEDAATHGARDVKTAPSNVLSIRDEILRLACMESLCTSRSIFVARSGADSLPCYDCA
jgi:hypothetical protein